MRLLHEMVPRLSILALGTAIGLALADAAAPARGTGGEEARAEAPSRTGAASPAPLVPDSAPRASAGEVEALVPASVQRASAPRVEALVAEAESFLQAPQAQLMLLGTFHFKDAGLDDFKPKHDIDILSKERQAELELLLDDLARYAPTRIGVEWPKGSQEKADELYGKYLAGQLDLKANEVYQIGFRLAKRLGLPSVDRIDAQGRRYEPLIDTQAESKRLGLARVMNSPWYPRYEKGWAWEDELKTRVSLQEVLLLNNDERHIRWSHGVYFTGSFKLVKGEEYPGPDHLTGWWYNRNLRIFGNILELIRSTDERVLVVIGSGHLPIIRHAAAATPELELVEPRAYIRIPSR